MSTFCVKAQPWIAVALLLALITTRSHLVSHVLDASWAIFFLAGLWVRSKFMLPVLWLAAFAVDYTVTGNGSVSSYCFTPAYVFTLPAYAALWFAGVWTAKQSLNTWQYIVTALATSTIGALACFIISNVGFYTFAGYFDSMSIREYVTSTAHYLPAYLQTTLLYVATGILGYKAILFALRPTLTLPR